MRDVSRAARKRGKATSFFFVVIIVIAALAAAESALRLLDVGGRPEDRIYTDIYDVRYRLRPGADNPCPGQTDRINSHGARGRDFETRRPGGVIRILCLGDSTTFGWNLPNELTYPSQLQGMLDQRAAGRYEVINAGIPGTNNFQQILFYEDVASAWEPDVVIWRVGPNARRDIHLYRHRAASVSGRIIIKAGRLFSGLRIYRGLRDLIAGQGPPKIVGSDDPMDVEFVQAYMDDLRTIAEIAERDRFLPIWLNVPERPLVQQVQRMMAERPDNRDEIAGETIASTDPLIIRFAKERGLPYVAPLLEFASHPIDEDLFVDSGHPGALGQRLCAEAIMASLFQKGIVPPSAEGRGE